MRLGIGFGLGRKRGGSLVQQAIDILRKYGTNAHIYLPGIGTVSGLTAGNYLDSAGTTAATVDNPVGLSLDALQAMTLGSELAPSVATGAAWSGMQAGWSVAPGQATVNSSVAGSTYLRDGAAIAGNYYQITYTLSAIAGTGVTGTAGAVLGILRIVPGTYTDIIKASDTSGVGLYAANSNTVATVTACSIKQIPGIHATQATTANKPILRQSGGKYSWQFDGVNDSLILSAPLFQMSDDHAVVAGCSPAVSSLSAGVVSQTGTNAYVPNLGFLSGSPYAYWRDDAFTAENLGGTSVSVGVVVVLTAVKIGNAKRLRQNGVQKASGSIVMGTSTITSQGIGQGGSFWNGSIYPVIAIKGTVTDADLLTLERFVGQLSGVTI